MKTTVVLLVALLGGCSYRVVVVSDCDAGIGDAAVLEDAGWRAGDVDWLVLHQANSRILEVIIIPNEGTIIIVIVVSIVIAVIIRFQRG